MNNEHTKAFRVQQAARALLRAEADQMGIELPGELNAIAGDLMDFAHALIHMTNDTLKGYSTEGLAGIPIGESTYVVMKDGRSLRSVKALGAKDANAKLKLKAGEELFIKVGDE
jgi:hypothetical protein